jgi:glyoxylase-like metal-dependent hydrolase (beta-lactamase superfamily II)
MPAVIEGAYDAATHTVTYLVFDPVSRTAAVVDPVHDYEPKAARLTTQSADALLARIEALGLSLEWVLETHVHADHLTAADYLRGRTGAKVVVGERIGDVQQRFGPLFDPEGGVPPITLFDQLVGDGDELALGGLTIKVMATPGHTQTCVSYRIGDAIMVGDTVFMPDYGTARTDFPGGDATDLYRSIRRILALAPETRVLTGHDYQPAGRPAPAWEASVAEHRAHNIHIHDGIDEASFVAMRQAKDKTLEPPGLILPSLQVNIRAGALPKASANGRTYLHLPVNAFG